MMQRKLPLFLTFLLLSLIGFAQGSLPPADGWRIHASFSTDNDLCEAGKFIYVASKNALFTSNKETGELEILSRINGLSDVTAVQIEFDPETETIIIAYDNTNIDLIRNGKVTNIPEIKNQLIIGQKMINNISVFNRKAYLSCSFGLAVIDLSRQKLVDSYSNIDSLGQNLPVYDMVIHSGKLFLAAGEKGIYSANETGSNLSDWNSWKKEYPISSYSHLLEVFKGKMYGVIDSTLKVYNGSSWDSIPGQQQVTIYDIKTGNDKMVVTDRLKTTIFGPTPTQFTYSALISDKGGIIASDSSFYIPVPGMYLLKVDLRTAHIDYISPWGPEGSSAIKMAYANGDLWVAGGGVLGLGTSSGWNSPLYSPNKFYRLSENTWHGYGKMNDSIINGGGDFVDIAINPLSGHAFLANFGTGILEVSGNTIVKSYTTTGTTLQRLNQPNYTPLLISGITFDPSGNLWVSNYGAINPLSVKTPSNQWYSFSFPSGVDDRPTSIICDDHGNKWMINTRSKGILVFNDNGTLNNPADDQYKTLSEAKLSGFLPSNAVFSMAKDKNGSIWVGTLKGLCIFNSPDRVFQSNADFDAQQIMIKTGLIYSNFLGDVPVYCITVDPGNRKWIGTSQGVWLVSSDGYTVIKNFTTSNSPLLSNAVYSIGIDESTGEVFFGTEKGMCSYAGSASEGAEQQDSITIYPNPVKPGFTGTIAIKGLLDGAYVKITDIGGNLIFETKANGGMANWNGNSYKGTKAPSGVYLVYSSGEKGEQTLVGKLLIVN